MKSTINDLDKNLFCNQRTSGNTEVLFLTENFLFIGKFTSTPTKSCSPLRA